MRPQSTQESLPPDDLHDIGLAARAAGLESVMQNQVEP